MILFGIGFALFVGGMIAWVFAESGDQERAPEPPGKMRPVCMVDPLILPICLPLLAIMIVIGQTYRLVRTMFGATLIVLIIYISLYYALLLCLLPMLRRIFSPRACAALWLLPNFLYLFVNFQSLCNYSPLFVLTVPKNWLTPIGIVWFCGFVSLILRQLISHLRYRRTLLRECTTVNESDVSDFWIAQQKRHGIHKRPIPLVVSRATQTPLTIGCFSRTMRLVLPHLNYTQEELRLIFRHELFHIQRADTRTKLFLGFCTALCWFNPLMWVGRRKLSDDLELSCDELVLQHEDEFTRKNYARLLLSAAGSGAGYTTCLSSAASSLRYRLKHVVKPRKLLSGSLFVGFVLSLLIFGCGISALADSPRTLNEVFFSELPAGSTVTNVKVFKAYDPASSWNEAALLDYISALPVREIYTAPPSQDSSSQNIYLSFHCPGKEGEDLHGSIQLFDKAAYINFPFDGRGEIAYDLMQTLDWEYINSLLTFSPNE